MSAAVLASITHPSELYALLKFKFTAPKTSSAETNSLSYDKTIFYLNKTSRSFARVIQELHPELRIAVAVFYLVLRGYLISDFFF